MNKTLKPFQIIGAKHLASGFHKMLADSPGLGKTPVSIAAALMVGALSVLIVCPASVRLGWKKEIEECLGAVPKDWDIISYHGASNPRIVKNLKNHYDVFIADEIHFCKTHESLRSKAIFGLGGLARRANYKWMLSGTPILNRPRELHIVLKCLASDKIHPYESFDNFAQKFCGAYYDGIGINTKGASNLADLSQRIFGGSSPFVLRRTKAEVFPELPQRIIKRIPIEVSAADWKTVEDIEREIVDREAFISSIHENYSQLGDVAKLRRATGLAKVTTVATFADELLETVDKVVVFTWHRDVLKNLVTELADKGRGCVAFQGGMNDAQKKEAVDRFVNDKNCTVFVGNMQAAGTGLNGLQQVTGSVIFAEPDWTPSQMEQAIGRVDRMGRKGEGPVVAYIPYLPGSIESAMLGSGDNKTRVIEKVLGSWNTDNVLGDLI